MRMIKIMVIFDYEGSLNIMFSYKFNNPNFDLSNYYNSVMTNSQYGCGCDTFDGCMLKPNNILCEYCLYLFLSYQGLLYCI